MLLLRADGRYLALADMLPEGTNVPEFMHAEARVESGFTKKVSPPISGTTAYRHFILEVDTMPVRGLVCTMAERLLKHALFRSADPRQDGSLIAAIELGAYAHAANDAPKKYAPVEVLERAKARLRSCGVKARAGTSSKHLKGRLSLQVGKPVEQLNTVLKGDPLGRAWMPAPEVRLSTAAGAAFRQALFTPKARGQGMEAEVLRTPLPEICSVIGNRLAPPKQPQLFKKAVREGVAKDLVLAAEALAEKKTCAKEITSVCTLKDRNLF